MKRNFEPVVKKQQKQKNNNKYRNIDEDYYGPRHPPKDNYKRKLKHRNTHDWDNDY